MKATELKRGDTCPACHGELKPAYVPTDDELRKASDRENPIALVTGADTAPKDQRDALGELFVCSNCGYKTRFAADTKSGSTPGGDRASDTSGSSTSGSSSGSGEGDSGDSAARGAAAANARRR